MQVTQITSINKDNRIKYIPLEEASMPVITKGENYIGSVRIEPSVTCKHYCYLGLSLDSNGILIILLYAFILLVSNLMLFKYNFFRLINI